MQDLVKCMMEIVPHTLLVLSSGPTETKGYYVPLELYSMLQQVQTAVGEFTIVDM